MECVWTAQYVSSRGNEASESRKSLNHYVKHQGNQGHGKKFMKKHDKGIGLLNFNRAFVQI